MTLDLEKTIPALETINLTVSKIMNPNSTKPSDPVRVRIYKDKTLATITNEDAKNIRIITSIPYTIKRKEASLALSKEGAGLPTNVTLSMRLEHSIQQGGGILIRYPAEVSADQTKGKGITVTVDVKAYGYAQALGTPQIDYSAREILFVKDDAKKTNFQGFASKIVVDPASGSQKMKITITGLKSPYNNQKSASFEIVTFNQESNVLYFIDQVKDGLSIGSRCSFPCKDCSSAGPTKCTSCFKNSTMPYLQDETCLSECSEGRYYDTQRQRCLPCDPKCLTCKYKSTHCTSCGLKDYTMLRINECVRVCGRGWIDHPSNNTCLRCKQGCTSCSKHTTNCTSCLKGSSTPAYFDYDCHGRCPAKISIDRGNDKCVACAAKCKTCSGEPGKCTSCPKYMRFDPLNKDCLAACKPKEQIYNNKTGECDTCQKNCRHCVNNITHCTACKPGFTLNLDSTCQAKCHWADGNKPQTPVKQICRVCKEPCHTCKGAADHCTTCTGKLLLYKKTCVDHCPHKYEANNATINQCILVGLICPAGYYVNAAGEGCVPNEFDCKPGYVINKAKTACIPGPKAPVPFPFFFAAICCVLTAAGSHMKNKESTKVYTILIFLIGSMEILQYALIAVYSAMLEKYFAAVLAAAGLAMLITTNIAFAIFYKRNTCLDKAYADWIRLHPKTELFIPLLCLVFNFKFARYVFSGFYAMDSTLAPFTSPRQAMHKQLKLMTYFSYVFVYIPIFLADLIIIFRVGWGHQVLVLAVETFFLQLLIVYLTYKEFQDPDRLYAQGKSLFSKLKPRKQGQVAVMGMFEDQEIDNQKLIRKDKGIRDYQVELRKRALTAILKQVGSNFLKSKDRGVDIGGEITKVYTKFDKKEIQLRRAFSCVELKTAAAKNVSRGGTAGTKVDEYYDDETGDESSSFMDSTDSKYEVL